MKFLNARSLALAAAGVACAASANAQSSVTIYGVADMYLQYGKGTATTYKVESGGESGSRLGFKGSEDLGGGMKAIFTLETGIGMDTGAVTQSGVMWGRQSWVGLSSNDFGTLTIGRLYNPVYNAINLNDPFALGLGSIYSSGIMNMVGGARLNNAVSYLTPTFSGFSANGVVALGEATTGKTWAIEGRYAAGPIAAGLTYVKKEKFGNAQVDASSVLGTASYNFGVVKVMGEVQSVKNLTQAVGVNDDRTEYVVGAQVPFGPHRITASFGGGKTKSVSNTKASEFSLGYQYALSKRTDLYAIASFINNGNATAFTASGSTGIGPATTAGQDVRAAQFGIRHTF